MTETEAAKARRLKKEAACKEILAGARTAVEVSEEWEVTHQAVSSWMRRFRSQGNLLPERRGRKKLRAVTTLDKAQFFQLVSELYEERGYRLGDEIPRLDRLKETELQEGLSEITGQTCSKAFVRRVARELKIPLYYEPLPHFPDDYVFEGDDRYLLNPFADNEKDPAPKARAKPPVVMPVEGLDEDEESIPTTSEGYAKWLEETRSILKERGVDYDPQRIYADRPIILGEKGHGKRTGKHAKNDKAKPRKARKKRRKG